MKTRSVRNSSARATRERLLANGAKTTRGCTETQVKLSSSRASPEKRFTPMASPASTQLKARNITAGRKAKRSTSVRGSKRSAGNISFLDDDNHAASTDT
ncbi:hypothetical protein D3C83_15300 [compost metagenome]